MYKYASDKGFYLDLTGITPWAANTFIDVKCVKR